MASIAMAWPTHRRQRAPVAPDAAARPRRAALSDQDVDSALVTLFSDVGTFEDLVLPALGRDLAACEKVLSEDPRLRFTEFLGLFFKNADDPAPEGQGRLASGRRAVGGAGAH